EFRGRRAHHRIEHQRAEERVSVALGLRRKAAVVVEFSALPHLRFQHQVDRARTRARCVETKTQADAEADNGERRRCPHNKSDPVLRRPKQSLKVQNKRRYSKKRRSGTMITSFARSSTLFSRLVPASNAR